MIKTGTGNTNILFDAGAEIDLQPGFEVQQGVLFETSISPCDDNN